MSYLVIARKWRPKLFGEIVGQGHVTRTLSNAVSSGRIAHAYLFSGPRGVGKTTAARILAKSVNCSHTGSPDPCNECDNCKAIALGSAVDCIEIDGASNTGVDNVRELRDSVRFVPASCKYKVYIIDEVHMLSTPAFNALLKTLEEPPDHVIFIFATTEVHKIPRTILSRCQRFDFKRISFKEISHHMAYITEQESIKVDDGVLDIIAREADGSLRDAQSLLDQTIAFAGTHILVEDVFNALGLMDRTMLFELVGAVLKKDGADCLNMVEKVYNFGYDLKRVCLELLELFRDIIVVKVTGERDLLEIAQSEADRLTALARGIGLSRLQMIFQVLTKGCAEISTTETQRFSLEMTLLTAASLDEVRPIGELIEELRAMGSAHAADPSRGAATLADKRDGARPALQGSARIADKVPTDCVAPPESKKTVKPLVAGSKDVATDTAKPAISEAIKPSSGALVDDKGFAGLLRSIKEKDMAFYGLLGNASLAIEGDTLSITLIQSLGFLSGRLNVLEEICSKYYNKKITIKIEDGACAGTAPTERKPGEDTLLKDALQVLGGRVVEGRNA